MDVLSSPTDDRPDAAPSRSAARRLGSVVLAGWASVTGIAPHVLHHVGPLAGTALVAGTGGQLVFGVIGFAATIPTLLKLRRRFGTWVAPAMAFAVFVAAFSLSTFVVGPQISGAAEPAEPVNTAEHATHDHRTESPTDGK